MIALESAPIRLSLPKERLIEILKESKSFTHILNHKSVRHLELHQNGFSFILKRAATFHFVLKKCTFNEVYYESKAGMPFHSVLRFSFNENESLVIDFETDTTPFMDFMMEKKVDRLLTAVVFNLNELTEEISKRF
jgi:hypothetical protein